MRVLFTLQPSTAHANLFLPTVRAFKVRGHDVIVATAASFVERVERADVPAVAAGFDWFDGDISSYWPDFAKVPRDQVAAFFIGTICATRLAPPMASSLDAIIEEFAPDLLVRDMTEFGAVIAAERHRLPTASLGFGPTPGPGRHLRLVDEPLRSLRVEAGSPPDLAGHAALHFAPRAFLAEGVELTDAVQLIRPDVFDGTTTSTGSFDPGVRSNERPLVYVSLGTVFSTPELFQPILDGLADAPIDVIATTGRFSPDELDVPTNARVEQYLPNSELLPAVDLVVTHGGYTTVMGILAAGKPMVMIPFSADHPANAKRCAAMEIGRVLPPDRVSPDTIRLTVDGALSDQRLAINAHRVAREIAAMPGPDSAVTILEQRLA